MRCSVTTRETSARHCNGSLITDERHISRIEFRLKGELLTPGKDGIPTKGLGQRRLDWERVAGRKHLIVNNSHKIICGRCGSDFSGSTRFPPGFIPGILGDGPKDNYPAVPG